MRYEIDSHLQGVYEVKKGMREHAKRSMKSGKFMECSYFCYRTGKQEEKMSK
jgi:hypothetical protein